MIVPTAWWHGTCNARRTLDPDANPEHVVVGIGGQDSCDLVECGSEEKCAEPSDEGVAARCFGADGQALARTVRARLNMVHARQSFAEHPVATKALLYTATAWMLIVAQCSAIPQQVEPDGRWTGPRDWPLETAQRRIKFMEWLAKEEGPELL